MKCGNGVYGNFEEKSPGNQVQSSEYLYMACFHPGGEGDSHVKGVGMLVVSHRGVNFRFWYRLGCSEQNTIIFSRKGLI